MAKFKVGQRVSVPFGTESRVEGKITRGPYPAPAEHIKFQLEQFGLRVASVYDVEVIFGDDNRGQPETKTLMISATHVRHI